MLENANILRALINQDQAHWTAIVKHNGRLWNADSCTPDEKATQLSVDGFITLLRRHAACVFYVEQLQSREPWALHKSDVRLSPAYCGGQRGAIIH